MKPMKPTPRLPFSLGLVLGFLAAIALLQLAPLGAQENETRCRVVVCVMSPAAFQMIRILELALATPGCTSTT